MEVNPTDRTRPDRAIGRARFRSGPAAASQPSEETCRCTSVDVSTSTAPTTTSKSSLTQRSGLFGVCLNCPVDDQRPCSSCSVVLADSQGRSSVMTTSVIATGTLCEDEGSVYNGKGKMISFSEFRKPSTTTAMTTPGAEEATVYNGKIGAFLFSGNQLDPHQAAVSTATSADIIRMLPLSSSPAIHTSTGAATEEQKATIFMTSPMSDYPMSSDGPGRSKRSRWQGNMTEDGNGTDQLPENKDVQEYPSTAVHLPAQSRPGNPSRNKRRKKERRRERVPAATSEKQPIPPDPHGYRWWKCGQKNIKGSPYPRSYYECRTGNNCDARREVMRAVDDPSMLDITYIGEHSHPRPAAAAAAAGGIVPAEPVEESATTKLTDFVEYL